MTRELTDADQHRFFTRVLAALPGPVSYMDRDLNYLYANAAYETWFGISPAECLRLNMVDVVGAAVVAQVRPYLNAAFAGAEQAIERDIAYARGGHRRVAIRYVPDRGPDGTVVGVVVIVHEISSERQRELTAQLAESQNYLRLVLDSSQHGIWGLNTDGEVTFINQRALTLLGYAREADLIGRPMHDLVHHHFKDGRPHPRSECPMYDSFYNRNTHHVLDDVLWRKDQTSFPVSYYSTPVIVGGACVGAVVTFEDITLQKQLEASLELERLKSVRSAKLASLGEMSAGIAHEINNPLAIIQATVAILPSYVANAEKFETKMESIRKSCARIARIVKGLQKFSRTGEKSNFQVVSLIDIVREAIILTGAKSSEHQTPVTLNGEPPDHILCDEIEIEQVIINLISNAIDAVKALDDRWVKISVAADHDAVVLRVTDSGPGIPEPARDRLFEPFFTTKEIGQGTGLGLSISKGILDEHRATIAVVEDGPNTCFEVRFTATSADGQGAGERS